MNIFSKISGILGLLLAVFCGYLVLQNQLLEHRYDSSFSFSADVESVDSLFNEQSAQFNPPMQSNTTLNYKVIDEQDGVLLIENSFDVFGNTGESIFSVDRIYGIDPLSGKHVEGYGDKDREGYLFAPKNLRIGESYTYWHANYDTPVEMNFEATEVINGVSVFRYGANFSVDQSNDLTYLEGVPEQRGVRLLVGIKTWIEPHTGMLINYTDTAEATFYNAQSGVSTLPWNNFTNEMSEASVLLQTNLARQALQELFILNWLQIPFLAIASAIFIGAYIFGVSKQKTESKIQSFSWKIFIIPFFIFIFGVVLSLLFYFFVRNNRDEYNTLRADREIAVIENAITSKHLIYENGLKAASGFVTTSDNLSQESWNSFIESILSEQSFPGVQAFNYGLYLPDGLTEQIKSQYNVELEGTDFSNESSVIIFAAPDTLENTNVIGFNPLNDSIRSAALRNSFENRSFQLSSKVVLLQDKASDPQNAYLAFLPVYNSPEETNAQGFVVVAIRIDNFIEAAFKDELIAFDFAIYDGSQLDSQSLLYKSENFVQSNFEPSINPDGYRISTVELGNHSWSLVYQLPEGYSTEYFQLDLEYYPLIFGVIITLLISGLLVTVSYSRIQANNFAQAKSEKLLENNKELQNVIADRTKEALDLGIENKNLKKSNNELEKLSDRLKTSNQELQLEVNELKKSNSRISKFNSQLLDEE